MDGPVQDSIAAQAVAHRTGIGVCVQPGGVARAQGEVEMGMGIELRVR